MSRAVQTYKTPSANGATNKVAVATAAYEGLTKIYGMSKEYWRAHFAYTVTVSEKDTLYSDVHDWLIKILPDEKHRSLTVSSGNRSTGDMEMATPDEGGRAIVVKPLVIRFNEKSSRTITIGGHSVEVSLKSPEVDDRESRLKSPDTIEFLARSHQGQQAVIRQLEELNALRSTTRKAVLKMVGPWGNWNTRSDLPPRTMASVSIPDEQKHRIMEDLKKFLAAEDQYNRLAIPWHRGYMFKGPPGTGKTSLVKALACEFNLDLWYVSLSDLKEESSLLGLLADVGPRSLLLLEDIDTAKITHDRDATNQGSISMSSLLNTLDGVGTPHGLITMMTTNRFDILDPALTRAGRMDMVEELGYPSIDTVENMYKHFYGKNPVWPKLFKKTAMSFDGISTSQIAEVFKRHMDDSSAATKGVLELFELPKG